MATVILTAVGTAIGGPIGGALGAILGQQIDRSVLGSGKPREGSKNWTSRPLAMARRYRPFMARCGLQAR